MQPERMKKTSFNLLCFDKTPCQPQFLKLLNKQFKEMKGSSFYLEHSSAAKNNIQSL